MPGRHSRFSSLYLFFGVFLSVTTAIRTVLLIRALPDLDLSLTLLFKIYSVGFLFDLVTCSYFALPLALYVILAPDRMFNSRLLRPFLHLFFFVTIYAMLFDTAAEYFFFDEFGTRFNFIAVDYLIYTTEVIRNIRESYPLNWILGGLFVTTAVIFFYIRKDIGASFGGRSRLKGRALSGALFIIVPLLSYIFIDLSFTEVSRNGYANEIAGDGIYDLFAAFKNNELDYGRFYPVRDEKAALARLRGLLAEDGGAYRGAGIERVIKSPGPERRLNVIVLVEESMGAEYMEAFGGDKGLTPSLDRLAGESLLFTHLYAAGTRTVRGLEAITLSVPPLPGSAIIKRPHNEGLFSWGSLMRSRGYDTRFFYGGDGYFDNMNYFFSNNGFGITDRRSFAKDEKTFANAWGVCDEDLYNKILRESDKAYRTGKPFFYMAMTTSNHRPYTYPAGRIDIPSGSGRDGAVKYADYAIGGFVRSFKSRPWARDTVLVIVADHCAGSARKVALPVKKYEIPLLIYSPANIKAGKVDTLCSQIDVAPTVLGLMGWSYGSKFLGRDILRTPGAQARAFISTYQRLGFIRGNRLVILNPKRKVEAYGFVRGDGSVKQVNPSGGCVEDAVAYYQGFNYIYKHGLYRE